MNGREREGVLAAGVALILLLTWLGFFLHRSPRFAGSEVGAVFGILGAGLLLVPLAYTVAKRIPAIGARGTTRVSLKALLNLHVYAGLLGPLFALVHTGHRFDSWLGIALTAVMLLVVVSGLVVRYLLTYVTHEIKDKLVLLQTARGDLDNAWGSLESSTTEIKALHEASDLAGGAASLGLESLSTAPARQVTRIAESVADLEYAVRLHNLLKRWFSRSLALHITLSVLLYLLLAMHIGAGIQFGLRWLP